MVFLSDEKLVAAVVKTLGCARWTEFRISIKSLLIHLELIRINQFHIKHLFSKVNHWIQIATRCSGY